ncbi:MAG TPA: polyketide cyclase, partial [Candidatus Flavonifractor merdigallinarum]|nr:polyketide cyclase [Candidatus Flavonifractor merdigallinarum]
VVTNFEDTSWRSDLARVEVLSETTFVEYAKSGYATTFTVTACEEPTFWAFRMENENMSGHWEGRFISSQSGTRVTFTESVTGKRFVKGRLPQLYLF